MAGKNQDVTIIEAAYIGSYPTVQTCPVYQLAEYAFIGRSNVGKSSLINMLCGRKDLARISRHPGKTQSINLYNIDDRWILADLPGYGYARVSRTMRAAWEKMIHTYLQQRVNLMCAFVLIDLRLPLQQPDRDFLAWVGRHGIPFAIVYTKIDKVRPRDRADNAGSIEKALLADWATLPPRFHTSAQTAEGRDALLQYIARLNDSIAT